MLGVPDDTAVPHHGKHDLMAIEGPEKKARAGKGALTRSVGGHPW